MSDINPRDDSKNSDLKLSEQVYIMKLLKTTTMTYDEIIKTVKGVFGEHVNYTKNMVYHLERKFCPNRSMIINNRIRFGIGRDYNCDLKDNISEFIKNIFNNNKYNVNKYILSNNISIVMKIYNHIHPNTCMHPGCDREVKSLLWVDGNNQNRLFTNIEGVCELHNESYRGPGTPDCNDYYKRPILTISKDFSFDASHYLMDYVGKCANHHGHRYMLRITLKRRSFDDTDMVMDFGELKEKVNKYVIDKLDHTCLNDVFRDINPTAENMVFLIWSVLEREALIKGLWEITLWETPTSSATLNQRDVIDLHDYYQSLYDIVEWRGGFNRL
ncbi:MAG: 6-carboxytetrahydropterin synthase QueD [bacterium]